MIVALGDVAGAEAAVEEPRLVVLLVERARAAHEQVEQEREFELAAEEQLAARGGLRLPAEPDVRARDREALLDARPRGGAGLGDRAARDPAALGRTAFLEPPRGVGADPLAS